MFAGQIPKKATSKTHSFTTPFYAPAHNSLLHKPANVGKETVATYLEFIASSLILVPVGRERLLTYLNLRNLFVLLQRGLVQTMVLVVLVVHVNPLSPVRHDNASWSWNSHPTRNASRYTWSSGSCSSSRCANILLILRGLYWMGKEALLGRSRGRWK